MIHSLYDNEEAKLKEIQKVIETEGELGSYNLGFIKGLTDSPEITDEETMIKMTGLLEWACEKLKDSLVIKLSDEKGIKRGFTEQDQVILEFIQSFTQNGILWNIQRLLSAFEKVNLLDEMSLPFGASKLFLHIF